MTKVATSGLKAFLRDPGEECIAVVQPGGDKSMDKLFRICKSECGMEFGKVPEVEEGGLADIFDVGDHSWLQAEKFRYVGVFLMKEGGMEQEMDRQSGALSAIEQALLETRQRFSSGIVIYSGRTLGVTSSDKVPEAVKHQQQLQSSALRRTSRQVINQT
ncbi:hypothetical protein CHARACLAT_029065 [Characodon lateralis]|uniref:Uncharacterized protein n=1 Tax=Characodon lateralis TaxID=208331 RepID=A0ABU7FA14_9TELE|nr:hypothetical protein [Characodon lateralis]